MTDHRTNVRIARPVRILYRRLFFVLPRATTLTPGGPRASWVAAYGLTAGHAKSRLLKKIGAVPYWPGTVGTVYYN